MKISHAFLALVGAAALAACDADEPTTQTATPTRPYASAADYTPALSGRAASEHYQVEFSVSALSTGRVAKSDNFEIRLGKAQ